MYSSSAGSCRVHAQLAQIHQIDNADELCICVQQADINDKMRAILIDWLVEVHLKFKASICFSISIRCSFSCSAETCNLKGILSSIGHTYAQRRALRSHMPTADAAWLLQHQLQSP